jgi:hypothetical protein
MRVGRPPAAAISSSDSILHGLHTLYWGHTHTRLHWHPNPKAQLQMCQQLRHCHHGHPRRMMPRLLLLCLLPRLLLRLRLLVFLCI